MHDVNIPMDKSIKWTVKREKRRIENFKRKKYTQEGFLYEVKRITDALTLYKNNIVALSEIAFSMDKSKRHNIEDRQAIVCELRNAREQMLEQDLEIKNYFEGFDAMMSLCQRDDKIEEALTA